MCSAHHITSNLMYSASIISVYFVWYLWYHCILCAILVISLHTLCDTCHITACFVWCMSYHCILCVILVISLHTLCDACHITACFVWSMSYHCTFSLWYISYHCILCELHVISLWYISSLYVIIYNMFCMRLEIISLHAFVGIIIISIPVLSLHILCEVHRFSDGNITSQCFGLSPQYLWIIENSNSNYPSPLPNRIWNISSVWYSMLNLYSQAYTYIFCLV